MEQRSCSFTGRNLFLFVGLQLFFIVRLNLDSIIIIFFIKKIPHFTKEIVSRCEAYEGDEPIESVFDILTLDDDVREELLQLPQSKMENVAVFCNNYPNIDVSFKVMDEDEVTAGDAVQIIVNLEREMDDEDDMDESEVGIVTAPLFPREKKEGWWLVIGDLKNNLLMSLKRVNLRHKQKVTLEFMAPDEPGDYSLTLFCMSDSYLGCDQEYAVPLNVGAALTDDEDEEDSDSEEE